MKQWIYANEYIDIDTGEIITKEQFKLNYWKTHKSTKHYRHVKDNGRQQYYSICTTRHYGAKNKQQKLF